MSLVEHRTDGPVAVITPSNAPANDTGLELDKEPDAAVLRARFDNSEHAIVLTGAEDRFFCAGADTAMLEAVTPRDKYYFCLHTDETQPRLEQGQFQSADAREGIEAFSEKRTAHFRGE